MGALNSDLRRAARASLVLLWLVTALVSITELQGQSADLLRSTGLPAQWHRVAIMGGATLDAAIGLALWRWHRPGIYVLAAANVGVMTLAATFLLPGLWLDPLGSLTKNLPIVALLWILHRDARA
jgi:hypothetical protein